MRSMEARPLSAAMVLGMSLRPATPATPDAEPFASALRDELQAGDPAAAAPASDAGATPADAPMVITGADLAGSGAAAAAVSGLTPAAGSFPRAPATATTGIFGFGRAALDNPAERARMAALLASMPVASQPTWSSSVGPASNLPENRYRDLLHGLAEEFQISETFITAVMLAESGGNPNAVGDNGHSVGLFQLHDQGMGHGLGDKRYDPEINARVGVAGLAVGWREGMARGLQGEELVRFAYDYRFNPGGGWKIQGDRVVGYWKALELQHTTPPDFASSAFAPKSLAWPVSGGNVTQEAHDGHMAVDIGVVQGTPVRAVAAGTVVKVERLETGYGWHVIVDHGGGWQTLYAHASDIYVEPGQQVTAGQEIAASGNTGKSTGPHLHFEVRYQGEQVDPLIYLR